MEKTKRQLRAEAVERLKDNEPDNIYLAIHQAIGWSGDALHTDEEWRDVLIDLLTDDDANDISTPENVVSADDVDANDANATQDTREKLEADVRQILHSAYMLAWKHGYEDRRGNSFEKLHAEFYNLLDRQAEITHAECERICDTCEWPSLAAQTDQEAYDRIAELQAQVDTLKRKLEASTSANDDYREEWHRVCEERMNLRRELTAEKNKSVELAEQLGAAMAERDEWRAKVGAMLDAAQEIRRIADIG